MEYENVCIECGKPFKTTDEDMNYCDSCWEKVVGDFISLDSEESKEEN